MTYYVRNYDVSQTYDIVCHDIQCRMLSSYAISYVLSHTSLVFCIISYAISHTISHTMFHLFQILGSELHALTSASFADSYSDCSITGTLPVLLQQPDSIATPCFPIPPRLASPPITGLPWNCFRGSPGCNPAPLSRRESQDCNAQLQAQLGFELLVIATSASFAKKNFDERRGI
jgi:hypothetical protein